LRRAQRLPALPAASLALATVLAAALAGGVAAHAQPAAPSPLKRIGFDQRVGRDLPADLALRDETGRAVRLGDYFGRRPVILTLVYYNCPMLCPLTLNGLVRSLKGMSFEAGREFDVVAVSFDPHEKAADAAKARQDALASYRRPGTESGWHFLTGDAKSIARLTEAAGFRYFYDEAAHQYAHAAGIVVLTPGGRLARYFLGIEFPSRDVRLAVVEAASGKVGTVVDQVLLYCFHYDPVQGRYSAATLNIVRAGAIATVLGLTLGILFMRRHEPAPQSNALGAGAPKSN
jgi:protein SCO1/2